MIPYGAWDYRAEPAVRELLEHLAWELAAEYLAQKGLNPAAAGSGAKHPKKSQARS